MDNQNQNPPLPQNSHNIPVATHPNEIEINKPTPPSFPLPEKEIPAHATAGHPFFPRADHPHHGIKWLWWLIAFFIITIVLLSLGLYLTLSQIASTQIEQTEASKTVSPQTPITQ